MKTAKIFTHGHSQAVRLPKEFRFNVDEVYIEKSGEGVILMPKKPDPWRNVRAVVGKFKGPLDRAQAKGFDRSVGWGDAGTPTPSRPPRNVGVRTSPQPT